MCLEAPEYTLKHQTAHTHKAEKQCISEHELLLSEPFRAATFLSQVNVLYTKIDYRINWAQIVLSTSIFTSHYFGKESSALQMTGFSRSSDRVQPASNSNRNLTSHGQTANQRHSCGRHVPDRGVSSPPLILSALASKINFNMSKSLPKVGAGLPGLPEPPATANCISRHNCPSVTSRDRKRQRSTWFRSHSPHSTPVAVH